MSYNPDPIKCHWCGRSIPYSDLENGKAALRNDVTDLGVSFEYSECRICNDDNECREDK